MGCYINSFCFHHDISLPSLKDPHMCSLYYHAILTQPPMKIALTFYTPNAYVLFFDSTFTTSYKLFMFVSLRTNLKSSMVFNSAPTCSWSKTGDFFIFIHSWSWNGVKCLTPILPSSYKLSQLI